MSTPSIMITNGGEHPVDKWAELTAGSILDLIQIRDGSQSRQAEIASRVKMELQLKLFDILLGHHTKVRDAEQSELTKDAKKRLKNAEENGFQPHAHLPSTLEEVNAALAATPFKAHFAQEHVQSILRNIIGQHTADVMHHEHRYHQDRAAKAAKGV